VATYDYAHGLTVNVVFVQGVSWAGRSMSRSLRQKVATNIS